MNISVRLLPPLALLAACAAERKPIFSVSHPANPRASEASSASALARLGRDDLTRTTEQRFADIAEVQRNEPPTIQQTGVAEREDVEQIKHEPLGNRETEAKPANPGAYTCAMHPEVHSDKPGKCPKCGMRLVRGKEASGAKHSH